MMFIPQFNINPRRIIEEMITTEVEPFPSSDDSVVDEVPVPLVDVLVVWLELVTVVVDAEPNTAHCKVPEPSSIPVRVTLYPTYASLLLKISFITFRI